MKSTLKWLNGAQFTGALIDNAFKMLTVIYLFNKLSCPLGETLALTSILLVIPFLLFSNLAGVLADRFSKRSLLIATKWAELAILLLAFPALLSGLAWPVYTILFLLAAQSALLGPAKRGIVPELVPEEELSHANGLLTGSVYLAIVLGLFLPSLATTLWHTRPLHLLAGCIAFSLAGLFCALRIAPVPAAGQKRRASLRLLSDALQPLRSISTHVWLKRAVAGSIAFAGITALFQQTLIVYGREVAELPVETGGFLFLITAIGIALGALGAGRFSRHTIELGLIPIGIIGLALSVIGLSAAHSAAAMAAWLLLIGISVGLCVVPLEAYIQQETPVNQRGELFGAISFFSFSAIIAASGLFYLLFNGLHVSARFGMLFTGLSGLAAAAWALLRLPDYAVRFLISRLTRFLYRVEVQGLENLPRTGGALIVSNHIAYGDATLIQSATQRPIRYLMSREVFGSWSWCRPIFKLTGAIPVHTSDGPRKLAESLGKARKLLQEGALISIFPEGELSKTGHLQPFHRGFEKILKGTKVPVIPVHLDNLWGSIFSFRHGNPGLKIPRRFPYPVTVRFGRPLPASVTADELRQTIAELGAETAIEKSLRPGNTLAHRFLHSARRHWFRVLLRDSFGKQLTGGQLLTAAVALNRRLKPCLGNEPNIGLLLPPSVVGALANTALTLQGRTVVNLNWTVSAEALRSAVDQSHLKQIITARKFLERHTLPELPVEWIVMDDLCAKISVHEKVAGLIRALFGSARSFADGRSIHPTDTACILFSSGSTGTPKGIRLSHANLAANLDALQQVVQFDRNDSVCGTLPFFHSFGLLGTLWWPLLAGVPTVYHHTPLQPAQIVSLIRNARLTTLLTTPTLLQTYLRKAEKDDFSTLRTVITGGEKLPEPLADLFEQKFGIRPLQGYGATELSPVATLSLHNRVLGNHIVVGSKPGSAGHPLPNVAARIVDPDTGAPRAVGESGLLLIKGPNLMQGYLNAPEQTAAALRNGWYCTGDIAHIDPDGFIFLTGRLSRFSKIAGEMVPHEAIEELLQAACSAETPCVAVVSIHDESKGEQLAVCYTPEAGDADQLHATLKNSRLPNLWIPARNCFVAVPQIPLLGSGKINLGGASGFVGGFFIEQDPCSVRRSETGCPFSAALCSGTRRLSAPSAESGCSSLRRSHCKTGISERSQSHQGASSACGPHS